MVQMSEEQARERWARLTARAWENPAFKQQLLANPRPILKEAGFNYADNVSIRIVEEGTTAAEDVGRFTLNEDSSGIYSLVMRLPKPPQEVGGELSEAELEAVTGGGWSSCSSCCTPCCCCT